MRRRPKSAPRTWKDSRRMRATVSLMVLLATLTSTGVQASAQPRLGSSAGWLETVNYFRAASGLTPVVEEPAWTAGIAAHLRYLKLTPASYRTGEYANAHTENPDSPHYTPEGNAAGRSSNLTSGSSGDRAAIESWMSGPFHAIGILRPNLQKVAFARDPETGAAGLDVIRGLVGSSVPAAPILFPGANSGIHLTAFRGENPNPLDTCGYQSAGLPLFALLPQAPVETVTADLTDSQGASASAPGNDLCVVTAANFTSSDTIYGPTGRSILQGGNAVLVIPRRPLASGRHVVRIHQPGRPDIVSAFYVTGLAGTPISGQGLMRVHVSDVGGATVMGNLTVTQPAGAGFTTAYPCAEGRPVASNNNYVAGETTPNFVIVRADASGDICVFTQSATHLIWDQVGQTTAFTTANATRKLDTRTSGAKIESGGMTRIHVSDVGGATVMGNLTVTEPEGSGFTTAYPCAEGRPVASNNNYVAGETTPNFVIVRADAAGDICVFTQSATHLIWDQVGQTTAFTTANATRKLDTRTSEKIESGGTTRVHVSDVAGATVMGNLTVTEPEGSGFTTAYPCAEGRPVASNNNYVAGQTTPNFVIVRSDSAGDLCVFTQSATHLLWDQVGQTSAFTTANARRVFDSRAD